MEQTFFNPEQLCDSLYKDATPEGTVERIRQILRDHGIETEELWLESSVPYCYSNRITVKGTTFGTNGKGITREFARASGYGELMERLQLGYLASGDTQKDGVYNVNDSQNEQVNAAELLRRNRSWYEALAEGLRWATGEEMPAEQILMQYAGKDGMVTATPFYNLITGTKEYIPTALRKAVYTTNGCAAGNSAEEALVQAISEIVERHHRLQLMSEAVTPPDVPEEKLKSCPIAYKIISYLREQGFRVLVKDCSLGTGFPVLCVTIIDPETGRYHTHLGAFPVFEIALERTLTETFQGRNIRNIADHENFLSDAAQARDLRNLSIELVKGKGEKLPNLFVGTPSYPFREDIGLKGGSNRELLHACVDYFRQRGLDILVRDSSCLGFHTYQILVPGYSEIYRHRLSPKHNDRRYQSYATRVLRNPSGASLDDIMGLYMHMKQTAGIHEQVTQVHSFRSNANLPVELNLREDGYYMAAAMAFVSYTMGRFADTVSRVERMIPNAPKEKVDYLICVKRYLSLKLNRVEEGKIRELLAMFHREDTVKKLLDCLKSGKNPMEEFTLHCDGTCRADCPLGSICCKQRVDELGRMINGLTGKLKFEDLAARLRAVME